MRKCFIVLFTIILVCSLNAKSQEKWNLKANIGTNYAVTDGLFKEYKTYIDNYSWYPGINIGTSLSYNVFQWLSIESGINFEKIRTGYSYFIYNPNNIQTNSSGYGVPTADIKLKAHYSKNYLNIPLLIQLKTSPHFGIFGGSGYRYNLNQLEVLEKSLEWNEWLITGGFFVNMGKLRTSLGYTQGMSEKSYLNYSRNRTVSISVSYTLWKK